MRLKQASNLFVISGQLVQQQQKLLDQCQHQTGLGPRGDRISLQRWLMELLPDTLADTSQAPMLCLLEEQGNILQRGLLGSLRGRVGLEKGKSGRLLKQARIRSMLLGSRF